MTSRLKETVEKCRAHVGCGDNSCRFVKPKGMATNGGCRCADRPFVMAALAELFKVAATQVDDERP